VICSPAAADDGTGAGAGHSIICAFAQNSPGKPRGAETKQQRCDWFEKCLKAIPLPEDAPIAVPFKIGCGLAGGDWSSYRAMLEESPRKFTVYKLG
jgi:hypothetical protein